MAIFKKDKVALDMQTISTLVSEGCVIDGNVKAPSFARIDGQITGDVMVDEGLILGEKGVITGNVVTKEMIVYGIVNGNLQVSSLQIKATGKITGDIYTQVLEVETGATYDGILSMTKDSKLIKTESSPALANSENLIQATAGKSRTRRPMEIEFKVEG